jgi:hypothetical protein
MQTIEAAARSSDRTYETLAEQCFKQIRETWERAIEEVLLEGAVQRFSDKISPGRLAKVDILPEDLEAVTKGYAVCCNYVHDRPAAGGVRIPEVEDLRREIERLTNFVKNIRQRRKK